MTLLDLIIVLIAALLIVLTNVPTAFVVIGAIIALIVVRIPPFWKRPSE